KILVTASSNLGVDNLLEKLIATGIKAVRLGHPARVMQSLRPHTLDYKAEKHEDARLARKMMKDAAVLFQQARRYTRAAPAKGSKQALWSEAKALMADARKLAARAVERVIDEADVICATTTGLDPFVLGSRRFSLVVLDEAGQCTEPNAWIPLQRAEKLICGGDHCQLPPTVLSVDAARQGLSVSLMERLVQVHGNLITTRLDVQYRMNTAIMNFSSQEFYEGALVAADAVKDRTLVDETPLLWIDTAGAGFEEEAEQESGSRFNPKEAAVILYRIEQLFQKGVAPQQLAVITPYAAQARYLRMQLADRGIEVDTIDGFQGREKDAVLISLVRSNEDQEVGFLKETRRLNVALTRARRHMTVVGDSATLSVSPFLQRLMEYFENEQAYHSIWEVAPDLIT
ncbi:MAG: AAA domain-containing protein, partial [Pseudobdellovibrionaceae bacterium]|nr:AAA domain-containing protein [Pseudobdellovibrionaceae bacterium]